MKGERTVEGLRCSEVLALLSDYLDGQLDEVQKRALEGHVSGCSVCEQFGGTVYQVLQALRRQSRVVVEASPDSTLSARLLRLKQTLPKHLP